MRLRWKCQIAGRCSHSRRILLPGQYGERFEMRRLREEIVTADRPEAIAFFPEPSQIARESGRLQDT